MTTIVLSAIALSFAVYLAIGFHLSRDNKMLGDFFPLLRGMNADIRSVSEFSSSQTAGILSFATIIIIFYDYAPSIGLLITWCNITAALGLVIIQWMTPTIRKRLSEFESLPTMHEFIGQSFGSAILTKICAVATVIGFLGAYALELTVCARFFQPLLGNLSLNFLVFAFGGVGLLYTAASGFRGVVLTDRVMLYSIWLFVLGSTAHYIVHFVTKGGFTEGVAQVMEVTMNPKFPPGLTLPLMMVAILLTNTFAYVADQSIFQRIVSANSSEVAQKGVSRSLKGSIVIWTWILLLACLVGAITPLIKDEKPLLSYLKYVGNEGSFMGNITLFMVCLGIIGASLSTASTLLISCANALYSDIVSKFYSKTMSEQADSAKALTVSRVLLVLSAVVSTVIVVQLFNKYNYAIFELVLAIFSSQLGMCLPIILAIKMDNDRLKHLTNYAIGSVVAGFVMGWGFALYGKISGNFEVGVIPAIVSFFSATLVLGIGLVVKRRIVFGQDFVKET